MRGRCCGRLQTDDTGSFPAQNVREALRSVTGRPYEIYSFAQHLNDFSDAKRGPILLKSGTKRRYRYKFINPLMQPYVIMTGLASGKITGKQIKNGT